MKHIVLTLFAVVAFLSILITLPITFYRDYRLSRRLKKQNVTFPECWMKDSEGVLADILADSEKSDYCIRAPYSYDYINLNMGQDDRLRNLVTMFAFNLRDLREKLFYSSYAPH